MAIATVSLHNLAGLWMTSLQESGTPNPFTQLVVRLYCFVPNKPGVNEYSVVEDLIRYLSRAVSRGGSYPR